MTLSFGSPRISILGKSASGKGTQSLLLAKKYSLVNISTGQMIRSLLGSLSQSDADNIRKGGLAPEGVIRGLAKEALLVAGKQGRGFVLDGFPRSIGQVNFLEEIFGGNLISLAVYIDVSDEEALSRSLGRLVCSKCGINYKVSQFSSYPSDASCVGCGNVLKKRADDSAATFSSRMDVFKDKTIPVINHYEKAGVLWRVDGSSDPGDVFKKIAAKIDC
ncbi:nucleoside monophosphate kinase [Nocardiopsis sp. NRRL B-16309]|uniref:adenylate kinase family protein n=1 Tax=Nocardiopsis sp. NRRL B-16309 TaxID=1519494 RepID=UPI0018CFF4BE|nr:nucleoside monophosphate kinase [Nocardiopsis sp. NRRL B-16309]